MNTEQFFNVILQNEQESIIDYVQKNNIECVIKIFDSYWKTQFMKTAKNNLIIQKKNNFKISAEKVIVYFESVGDQYFFETIADGEDSRLTLKLPESIFKLQRRNDFRVTIPGSIQPTIKLKNYPELKTELRDLSLGGCKVSLRTEFKLDATLDSEIRIQMKILDFDEKDLPVIIKFSEHNENTKTMILGLQFLELDSEQTSIMRNTILQIDRKLRGKTTD